jgi:hypothetical protein
LIVAGIAIATHVLQRSLTLEPASVGDGRDSDRQALATWIMRAGRHSALIDGNHASLSRERAPRFDRR